ncbi:mersacidin/lichenicidin family type 2 lantibiotic [Umezawaea tangerina]|uniref:Mersacidin/lichenicidin family type 2 lantibiotic n=1 Tax=Umezawaea tangerina TaxID=84725 RepID=A0A2T0THK5_9PSEU|nr:mersacidin/lichenicidin family type 2 lantibiotic [Umezawaea tangerina]PRY45150.1 mersacidin/lichenicidin family type 2 lantibiotic [Umezawaea tangerina]
MTAPTIDVAETVRLWKDPDARWKLAPDSCPPHPAGEMALTPAGPTGAGALCASGVTAADTWTLSTFTPPSVSGPCLGYGSFADDRY